MKGENWKDVPEESRGENHMQIFCFPTLDSCTTLAGNSFLD